MHALERPRFSFLFLVLILILQSQAGMAALVPTWQFQTLAPILSSPKMADLDGDGTKEILITTYSQDPGNPYNAGYVRVLGADGVERPGWPFYVSGSPISASPAIADLNQDGIQEIVIGTWSQLYVLLPDGSVAAGFPRSLGTSETPTLHDLAGTSDLEIVYPSNNRLYVLDRTGTTLPGWPYTIQSGYFFASAAVGDIDGDGQPEIVAGSAKGPVDATPFQVYAWEVDGTVIPGWPFTTSGVVKAAPALADMDGDGDVEIAATAYDTSNNDYVYLLQGNGTLMPGWPQRANRSRLSSPALADLDGDGTPEIIIGGWYAIYAFHANGTACPGFPVTLADGGQINDGPIVADLDGDGTRLEILAKNQDRVHGYHSDGSVMANFPFVLNDQGHTGTFSPGPLAGDVEGDGDADLLFCANYDVVYFFESFGPYDRALAYWPTYKHDVRNTANLELMEEADAPEETPAILAAGALSCSPNPSSGLTWIRIGPRNDGGRMSPSMITLFDISGHLVRALPVDVGSDGKGGILWDGRDEAGHAVASGAYFVSLDRGRRATRLVMLR